MISDIKKYKNIPGVYKYTNINTNALYIGSAKDMYYRHMKHVNPLDIDIAIANEGIENFTFEVLEEFPVDISVEKLRQSERKWIEYYNVENDPLHYNKPNNKYNIWDVSKVEYRKIVFNNNKLDPRRCFRVNSPNGKGTYRLPIGGFNEFVSPTIIYDLSQKWS